MATKGRSRTGQRAPLTEEERAQRDAERREKLEALHEQFTAQVAELVDGERWRAMLAAAGRFHQYSLGNVLLILAQNPEATRVAGYRTWQSLGRQVRKGERGIRILAPCVYRTSRDDEATGETIEGRRLGGVRAGHAFRIAPTDRAPRADIPPGLLARGGPPWV